MAATPTTPELVPIPERIVVTTDAVSAPSWLDDHMGEVTQLPRGRKGLWGALARQSVRGASEQATWMPPVDTAALAPVLRSMFDIDPLATIDLTAV
jgi:hypothetical protein